MASLRDIIRDVAKDETIYVRRCIIKELTPNNTCIVVPKDTTDDPINYIYNVTYGSIIPAIGDGTILMLNDSDAILLQSITSSGYEFNSENFVKASTSTGKVEISIDKDTKEPTVAIDSTSVIQNTDKDNGNRGRAIFKKNRINYDFIKSYRFHQECGNEFFIQCKGIANLIGPEAKFYLGKVVKTPETIKTTTEVLKGITTVLLPEINTELKKDSDIIFNDFKNLLNDFITLHLQYTRGTLNTVLYNKIIKYDIFGFLSETKKDIIDYKKSIDSRDDTTNSVFQIELNALSVLFDITNAISNLYIFKEEEKDKYYHSESLTNFNNFYDNISTFIISDTTPLFTTYTDGIIFKKDKIKYDFFISSLIFRTISAYIKEKDPSIAILVLPTYLKDLTNAYSSTSIKPDIKLLDFFKRTVINPHKTLIKNVKEKVTINYEEELKKAKTKTITETTKIEAEDKEISLHNLLTDTSNILIDIKSILNKILIAPIPVVAIGSPTTISAGDATIGSDIFAIGENVKKITDNIGLLLAEKSSEVVDRNEIEDK